jgi:hypothetical protein
MYKNNKLIISLILMLCSTYAHSSLIFTDTANTNITGGAMIGGVFQSDVSCGTGGRNTNCYYGSEFASNLLDGNSTTKYYNGNRTTSPVSVFFERADNMAFHLEGFGFTLANDSPDRDPISFSFYGTNNDTIEGANLGDLTLLTSDAFNYPNKKYAPFERTFAPASTSPAFSNFLVVFNDLRGTGTDAQLSELRLLGTVQVPEPTTLAIFALGMVGLAARRFKKQS